MDVLALVPHKVEYRKYEGEDWRVLSDTYESFARAATVATALENRGYQTKIKVAGE